MVYVYAIVAGFWLAYWSAAFWLPGVLWLPDPF